MNVYYQLTATTSPFLDDMVKEIGCYKTKELALKACKFLMEFHTNVDWKTNTYYDEFVYCKNGIRLKSTPKGKITMIIDKLDKIEYQRLLAIELKEGKCEVIELKLDL